MTEEQIIRAVDAAMAEMENIHPPLRRSECERLIRAALAALDTEEEPEEPDHVRFLNNLRPYGQRR